MPAPHVLVFTPLCSALLHCTKVGLCDQYHITESDDMSFLRLVYKKILSSILGDYLSPIIYIFFSSFYLPLSHGSLSLGEVISWATQWKDPCSKEQKPLANSHMNELESTSFSPVKSWGLQTWLRLCLQSHARPWVRTNQLSPFRFLTLRNYVR